MPRKTKVAGSSTELPRFTIDRPPTKSVAVGKLVIPKCNFTDLPVVIEKCLQKIPADVVETLKAARGTITLY